MFKRIKTGLVILFVFCFISASCKKQKNDTTASEYLITFSFTHRVGADSLEFDTIRYVNEFGNKYSVVTLRYFISDITLHRTGDGIVFINEEHYIDASDPRTFTFIPVMKVPAGDYSGISFIFGLDSTKNVTGSFLNPPENKMEWPVPLGGGYHYMKLEGKFDSSGMIQNYQAHTGPLMGVSYFIKLDLSAFSFTINKQGEVVHIIMDINQWWRDPATIDLNNITSIMENSFIQQQLKENGADVFSVESIW